MPNLRRAAVNRRRLAKLCVAITLTSLTGSMLAQLAGPPALAATGPGGGQYPITGSKPSSITWASQPAPFGYAYDVQVEAPGGSYTTWLDGATADTATFSSDSTTGSYSFRARLRNTSTGAQSGWSPAGELNST